MTCPRGGCQYATTTELLGRVQGASGVGGADGAMGIYLDLCESEKTTKLTTAE